MDKFCEPTLGNFIKDAFFIESTIDAHLCTDGVGDGADAVNLAVDNVAILRRGRWVKGYECERDAMPINRKICPIPTHTLSQRGSGLRKQPTPGGVPVKIRSPGLRVIN